MKLRVVHPSGQVVNVELDSITRAEEIRERLRQLHGWDCCIKKVTEEDRWTRIR